LRQVKAEITISFAKDPPDPRALELINKTNQFNLNGRRWDEAAWNAHLQVPETFLLVAAYRDKYGPLGKIATLCGRCNGRTVHLDTFVMSCRAFSRRIEHRCLEALFNRYDAQDIVFDFAPTPRNVPLQEFLAEITESPPAPGMQVSRATFLRRSPPLFHEVRELADVGDKVEIDQVL
jgi:FkbH-like protein